jgi:hypothetical protein
MLGHQDPLEGFGGLVALSGTSGRTVAVHYTGHFGSSSTQVVVHDHGVGDQTSLSFLLGPLGQAPLHVCLVVAAGAKSGRLHLN